MNKVVHKANTRGHDHHGWLDTYHTFSFANYYDPDRMHFGVLRVLNDDTVEAGHGFGRHPHDNMEIISIPLSGSLEHKDSMGNTYVIKENDVQVMSAGKGIAHSEYNREQGSKTNFLQIWVFPNKKNVEPRYNQMHFDPKDRKNKLQLVISPHPKDGVVWIHQNAWFSRLNLESGRSVDYQTHMRGNGIYIFIVSGNLEIGGEELESRDGIGIWDSEKLSLSAKSNSELLIMEVPMKMA